MTARCSICLDSVPSDAPSWTFACGVHPIHLECIVNARAREVAPACPVCRIDWTPYDDERFAQLELGQMQPTLIDDDVVDDRSGQPPMAPQYVLPMCCNRIFLDQDTNSYVELPDKTMYWLPILVGGVWEANWHCYRCGRDITWEHVRPTYWNMISESHPYCWQHRLRTLVISYRAGDGEGACGLQWACTVPDSTPDATPVIDHRCGLETIYWRSERITILIEPPESDRNHAVDVDADMENPNPGPDPEIAPTELEIYSSDDDDDYDASRDLERLGVLAENSLVDNDSDI